MSYLSLQNIENQTIAILILIIKAFTRWHVLNQRDYVDSDQYSRTRNLLEMQPSLDGGQNTFFIEAIDVLKLATDLCFYYFVWYLKTAIIATSCSSNCGM